MTDHDTQLEHGETAATVPGHAPGRREVTDRFGRVIDYLRMSLTDMCNLRCVYCMPADATFRPPAHLLQTAEVVRLAHVFAELGFGKIRFTGGEPTLRDDLVPIVRDVAAIDGLRTVALTTNGLLLDQLAAPLREAGLRRVNISLDCTDQERFRRLTRWGNVRDVFAGIRAAEDADLEIKLNCVVVRGVNDGEDVADLARLTLEHPWQVRFVEMMPFGGLAAFQREHIVSEAELVEIIAGRVGPLDLQGEGALDGEARVYRLRGAAGSLGFVSAVTQPFCAGCNRIRLTADGVLRMCLLREKEIDLLTPLRRGLRDEELKELVRAAVWAKPWGHGLADNAIAGNRNMSEIGG